MTCSDGSGLESGLESPHGPTHFCKARPARSPIQKARGLFRAVFTAKFGRFSAKKWAFFGKIFRKFFLKNLGFGRGQNMAEFWPNSGRELAKMRKKYLKKIFGFFVSNLG